MAQTFYVVIQRPSPAPDTLIVGAGNGDFGQPPQPVVAMLGGELFNYRVERHTPDAQNPTDPHDFLVGGPGRVETVGVVQTAIDRFSNSLDDLYEYLLSLL